MKRYFLPLFTIPTFVFLLWFYFVPAFSGMIAVSPDVDLGFIKIHLYGLALASGILGSFLIAKKFSSGFFVPSFHIENIVILVAILGFIGARLYYVIFSWGYFSDHILEIFFFWRGGLSIYGAIISGIVAMYWYAKKHNLVFLQILDLAAMSVPIGQAIGRFGNFFNQEAYGEPTSLPWKLYIDPTHRPVEYFATWYFHPTFLYEAVWNLLIFLVLYVLSKKHFGNGFFAGLYLVLYSTGRLFIEGLRLDSFYVSGYKVDQIVAGLGILAGGVLIYLTRLSKKTYAKIS